MRRISLFFALFCGLALPALAVPTDTPTPTSTPTITNTPTITLTPTPTSTRTRTPTPIPPGTVQITGLPSGAPVVDGDEFPIDKLVSAVRRTRRVTALEIFDYIRQQSIIFTGTITINGIIILPDGSAPDPLDCDSAPEEDGRVFIDTSNPSGAPQLCICNGVAGWNCTTAFGASIDDTELTAEDFGSFTCTGSEDGCLLNAGSVGSTEIANGSVTTTDIADGTITEPDLSITNSASAGNALTSDGATGFTWVDVASLGVAGSDTQVQFNDGGTMAGDAGLTYNKTSNVLTVTGGSVQGADAAGPALLDEAASDTNPTLLPNRGSADDGIGFSAANCPVLIEAGKPVAEFCDSLVGLGAPTGSGVIVTLRDNGVLALTEDSTNGTQALRLTAPAALSGNQTCTLRDNSRMIPASCVEDNFSGSGSALVGGSDTQVQFNDSSTFGGDAGLTYNKSTDTLTAVTFVGALTGNASTASDLACTNCIGNTEIDGSTLESEIEAVADLQDFQGAVTDAQVPDNITVSLAAVATAINPVAANAITGIADDQVILGASANTAAFATVPNCVTGKLTYTQSTNTWGCGTDAVGFGGSGTGEYNPDNYPTSGTSATSTDEFTVLNTPTLTWTQRNPDSQTITYDLGMALLGAEGSTDAWHGITTPSLGDVDFWVVAKAYTSSLNVTTRGCGISIIHEGTAAAPTEINSLYLRGTSTTAAAIEFLSHDDYDFASPVSIGTDTVSASGPDVLGVSLHYIYFMLGWVAATDDITAFWSWDGVIFRGLTTDTTAVSPVAIGLFTRDDSACGFAWVRTFTTTPFVGGTPFVKIGS